MAFAAGGRRAFDLRHKVQVGLDRHFRVERRIFREIADPAPDLEALLKNIVPGDARGAVARRHVAGEDAHRGGLARAVRPQKSEDFTLLDGEGNCVHRLSTVVHFG